MRLADFDYELPAELIARYPAAERRDSRLLEVGEQLADRSFADLPDVLRAGDLLVFNDTRVIPARLRGRKETGGRVEVLVERLLNSTEVLAQLRASKPPGLGSRLEFGSDIAARVAGRSDEFYRLEFAEPVMAILEARGEVPLPPYLGRDAEPGDRERYQTVYAASDGAVAAPTAGLHFDKQMLDETRRRDVEHAFVTLHIGAGTFQPLRDDDIAANRLHSEHVIVDEACCAAVSRTRARGGRVIAVGTTSVRALETAARDGSIRQCSGETDLFIRPGYEFRCVDAMLTNFHLPRSSLLLLVAAFAGRRRVLDAYAHAVRERYRFFSYGDAMFLQREKA